MGEQKKGLRRPNNRPHRPQVLGSFLPNDHGHFDEGYFQKTCLSATRQFLIDITLYLDTFKIKSLYWQIGQDFYECAAKPLFLSEFGLKIFS